MTTDPYGSPRAWSRRPAFVIAATFLAVVLVGGLALTLWPDRGDPAPPTTSPTSSTGPTQDPTSTSTTPADPDASICGLEPGPQDAPATPPADAEWALFGTFAAPSVDGIGPGLIDGDGLRHCFAHSPTGALLAAINAVAMPYVDPLFQADERVIAETPERQLLQEEFAAEPPPPTAGPVVQLTAYLVEVRDGENARVALVLRRADTAGLTEFVIPVRWEAGDWKVVLPDGGAFPSRPITSVSGYTQWGGA